MPPAGIPGLAALLLLAACGGAGGRCEAERTPTPLDPGSTGTITGTVTLDGPAPAMTTLRLASEPACSSQHAGSVLAGDALVHDGRVENAFVYIKEGLGERVFAVPAEPVTVDQRGCVYRPHVTGARVCQPIAFLNSDPVLHNVHGRPVRSASWNFSMGVKGSRRTVRIETPEVMVEVGCDVHPWMRAYLGVLEHPYFAVTGPDGRFTLPDVPAGDYLLASWHERFGVREGRVRLGAGETAELRFAYASG
jgi:plastocyanin